MQLSNGAVTTIAGSSPPTAALGSTDETGSLARFNGPQGLYYDSGGDFLLVADYGNHTIRRVGLPTGEVTTVVGNAGSPGSTNATGASARLRFPIALAPDGNGSVFLAEDGNHDVRVVALSTFAVSAHAGAANVSGFANGIGSAGLFFNPRGIAFDASGNYYVGDFSNGSVRKVVVATAAVSTVAGFGAAFGSQNGTGTGATFNFPNYLAFDGQDTIYASDFNAHVIRTITLSTGAVTTFAGSPGLVGTVDAQGTAARFSNPTGIALDGHGNLFVADRGNHTVRRIVLATAEVTTIAGAPATPGFQEGTGSPGIVLHTPWALAHDGGNPGNLFVSELNNRIIRRIRLANNASSTVAGVVGQSGIVDGVGAAARLRSVTGLATKGDGKLWIGDSSRIRVFDLATESLLTVSGNGGYSDGKGALANFSFDGQMSQLSLDASGNLLVADFSNHVVRSFSTTTLTATTLAGIYGNWGAIPGPLPTPGPMSPRGVVAIPNGIAYAASFGVWTVR